MKNTNSFISVLSLISLIFILYSCVNDDDFNIPTVQENQSNENIPVPTKSIGEIRSIYNQSNENNYTFDSDVIVRGYVISSDEDGSFYKELIIQDGLFNNPKSIKLLINDTDLYQTYELGRQVILKLEGLSMTKKNEEYIIGILQDGEILEIGINQYQNLIFRDNVVLDYENISHLTLSVNDILSQTNLDYYVNSMIRITDIQFSLSELGKTYAGEATDNFDGERILVQCDDMSEITLSTSTFSSFKSLLINSNRGSLRGILQRDFMNNKFVIRINNLNDIDFGDSNRCDPGFYENFNSENLGEFDSGDWTNFNELGSVKWEVYEDNFSLDRSIRLNPFNTGNEEIISWLITPSLDLDQYSNLNFKSSNSFADNSNLIVLISTDWNGDPATINNASWDELNANIVDDSISYQEWVESGLVNLENYQGEGYIAFKYFGNSGDSNNDGTYEIDDIVIF